MAKRNHLKETRADKAFDVFNVIFATLCLLIILYPVIIVLSSSFSDAKALMAGKVWFLPVKPTVAGYYAVLRHKQVWTGMYNSVIYTVVGTVVSMIVTVMAAYPLSRKDFTIGGLISLLFAFTMWFSGGLIPTYLLVKNLGLFNSRWSLIIPSAMSVWNMIIIRTYFQTNVAGEILESAKLDGCDDFRYLLQIAVPLAKPSLAVIALYYMVAYWNVFMSAYLYIQDQRLYPIQIVLREILLLGQVDELNATNAMEESQARLMSELLKYSLVIVASLPMVLIYPMVQKYFVKGIMIGSVKG
ncbi:MAG: carbohydrate ABC transporter permease [Ruminococcaceae bacterium]|nr:carbohydrate ABC transporter permease [Oscillospiraceae bacterium]